MCLFIGTVDVTGVALVLRFQGSQLFGHEGDVVRVHEGLAGLLLLLF